MISSVLSNGLAGVQKGYTLMQQNAQHIAQSGSNQNASGMTSALVNMQANQQQVQGSLAVVRTADQMLGFLIDTRA